jgi:hypothetical protein
MPCETPTFMSARLCTTQPHAANCRSIAERAMSSGWKAALASGAVKEGSIYRRRRILRPIRGNTRVLINAPCALADSSSRKSCENSERNLFLKKSKRGTFFGLACYVSRVAGADAMTALDSPDAPPRRRSPRLIVDFLSRGLSVRRDRGARGPDGKTESPGNGATTY